MIKALNNVIKENWKKGINHVQKVDRDLRIVDFAEDSGGLQLQVERMIIQMSSNDSDSESDDDFSDDEFLEEDF